MHVSDAWTPPLVRVGDSFLMDQFRARGFKPHTMYILNKCRMYLNIITVADITNPHGTHVDRNILLEKKTQNLSPQLATQSNTYPSRLGHMESFDSKVYNDTRHYSSIPAWPA